VRGIVFTVYSAHSPRQGFANWAIGNGWDIKILMALVDLRNVES